MIKNQNTALKNADYEKGRGAQINPSNPFESSVYEHWYEDGILPDQISKTKYIEVEPKTIVNKVESPDVPFKYSMNPYQGCEHGCVYCYARNSHAYWAYSIGADFESRIMVKRNAVELLEKKLSSSRWQASPIMLSGNTDCYQPAEHRYRITRELLKVFLKYKHPVGIITKNSMILRDLDILKSLNKLNLVRVAVSITSLDERLRQMLEPKTASANARIRTVKTLSDHGIPVSVMMAPIIPSLNSQEILEMCRRCAEAGARDINPIILRLNGQLKELFEDWLRKNYPLRANKILKHQAEAHGGQHNDNRFGKRMRGEGEFVEQIHHLFKLGKKRYFKSQKYEAMSTEHHIKKVKEQLSLF